MYPLSPRTLVEEYGSITDTDSDDDSSSINWGEWGEPGRGWLPVDSMTRPHEPKVNQLPVNNDDTHSGCHGSVGSIENDQVDQDSLSISSVTFTEYESSVINTTCEMLNARAALREKRVEEDWDDETAEEKAHSVYKSTSRQYRAHVDAEIQHRIDESKKKRENIRDEIKACKKMKTEVKRRAGSGSKSQATSEEVLISINGYAKELKKQMAELPSPWKLKLGLMDEFRQTKKRARKDLGLKQPLLSRLSDFILHKMNKSVNNDRYTIYKTL